MPVPLFPPKQTPKLAQGHRGQLSIFLGISLLVVVTLMGFIVNVGLFVKAKINLQNSVDAAAYAGAAVQARQLTNIGYLNWEMRNNYKEWMYKYYVLGQLGLPSLRTQADDQKTHFRLRPFNTASGVNPDAFDRYNLPTVCIHFGSESNVCEIYQVPGLPRFDNVDIPFPGIVEHHKAFLNSIVATKSKDCSTRSALNQGTAMIWAYGTQNNAFANVPLVAGDRPGAWISSIEMGIRMRNLEAVVNRPPVSSPICIAGSGCKVVNELEQENDITAMNERPVKAFMSAYRNLGGGAEKEPGSENFSRFAQSLKLTEVSPEPQEIPQGKLSTFLIPPGGTIAEGVQATTKTYLDLQAMPLNLVTFFTTMVSATDDAQIPDDVTSGLVAEGECAGTRTALPVPGFIFGFIKNPQVLTYYAVKGEADFVGLFYPFRDKAGITLQAYAAAKPFGGRIGPRLFHLEQNSMVMARADDSLQFRSGPYLSGLEVPETSFKRGYPIPVNDSFWITDPTMPLGGVPTSGDIQLRFSIPNLLYDYTSYGQLDRHGINEDSDQGIQIVGLVNTKDQAMNNTSGEDLGLYMGRQYNLFRNTTDLNSLISSSTITADKIERAIIKSRMPTKLEAINYMIPHIDRQFSGGSDENLEQPAAIQPLQNSPLYPGEDVYAYDLYAPLSGPGTLYPTGLTAISTTLQNYLIANQSSIETFLDSLKDVADSMKNQSAGGDGITQADYTKASEVIYRESDINNPSSGCTGDKQLSMAGKFHIFFKENSGTDICEVPSLIKSVTTYINNASSDNPRYETYYRSEYAANPALTNSHLMTGYMPGPRQGSDESGKLLNPYSDRTDDLMARRNIYSTKFVSMASLTEGQCNSEPFSYCYSYLEQPVTGSGPSDFTQEQEVKNYVRTDQLTDFFPLQF